MVAELPRSIPLRKRSPTHTFGGGGIFFVGRSWTLVKQPSKSLGRAWLGFIHGLGCKLGPMIQSDHGNAIPFGSGHFLHTQPFVVKTRASKSGHPNLAYGPRSRSSSQTLLPPGPHLTPGPHPLPLDFPLRWARFLMRTPTMHKRDAQVAAQARLRKRLRGIDPARDFLGRRFSSYGWCQNMRLLKNMCYFSLVAFKGNVSLLLLFV